MNEALDAIPGGVITLSSDLRIVAANQAMAALVGRPVEELIGQPVDAFLSGSARILFQTHVYPALKADGRVEEVFLTLSGADGEVTPVLLNATRTTVDDATTYEALIVRILARSRWERDLLGATRALEQQRKKSQRLASDLSAAADDLAARYEEEQRTHQFREAFIAVIGHELRTPITTLFGMSHRLQDRFGTLPEETVREYLKDMADEADRLRRLAEDLLVLSRAEGGRLVVDTEALIIGHTLRRAVEREHARAPGHSLTLDAPAGLPLVLGEEVYVEQVVHNYISNAVKYSPAGTEVRIVASDEDDGIAVRVIDAGQGLGDESPEQLFELFYRAPDAVRKASGAGIGLFVCRELIKAMNGRVWAANAEPPGTGAEFGLWLPAAPDE